MKKALSLLLAFLVIFVSMSAFAQGLVVPQNERVSGFNAEIFGRVRKSTMPYDDTYAFYVIDTNTVLKFDCPLDLLEVQENYETGEVYFSYDDYRVKNNYLINNADVCTVGYEVTERIDIPNWKSSTGEKGAMNYIKPGSTVKINKPGMYVISSFLGYNSEGERLSKTNGYGSSIIDGCIEVWVVSAGASLEGSMEQLANAITSGNMPAVEVSEPVVLDSPAMAKYTASSVYYAGSSRNLEAYNIDDNNYFKLRDVAALLSGSSRGSFDVSWDASTSTVSITSGKPYTPVGGELAAGDGSDKVINPASGTILCNNSPVTLNAVMINNNNYFKLRDLGQLLDFDVTWDAQNNRIVIDGESAYTPD